MSTAKQIYDAIRALDASDMTDAGDGRLIVDASLVDALCGLTVEGEWALLLAAPDLLAACETALECLVDGGEDDGEAGEELRAAIAKAKGATP